MEAVDTLLREWLGGARRLAVLGAGSTLRADDGAGVRVVEILRGIMAGKECPSLLLCPGETAPENYSGTIRRFGPSHVLAVDAADMGGEPGSVARIDPGDVGGPTFCSHMLPLRVMIDYLAAETGASVLLLGIQPESTAFDAPMTPKVEKAVEELCGCLAGLIGEMF